MFEGMCGAACSGSLQDGTEVRRCIVGRLLVVEMTCCFVASPAAAAAVIFQSCPFLQYCGTRLDTVDIQVAKHGTFELGMAVVDGMYFLNVLTVEKMVVVVVVAASVSVVAVVPAPVAAAAVPVAVLLFVVALGDQSLYHIATGVTEFGDFSR